jgi:hypothetical protein
MMGSGHVGSGGQTVAPGQGVGSGHSACTTGETVGAETSSAQLQATNANNRAIIANFMDITAPPCEEL